MCYSAFIKAMPSRTGVIVVLASLALPAVCFANGDPGSQGIVGPRLHGVGPEHDRIAVDVIVSKLPKPSAFTALDLSAEGQAAYIEAFADTPEEIVSALTTPIKRDASQPEIDQSKLSLTRRLAFTLLTKNMLPPDGIVEAHIKAALPADWRFAGWSGFSVIEADIKTQTVDNTARESSASNDDINRNVQSLTKIGWVRILPRLHANLAEFVLNTRPRSADLSGSYTVDVTLQYEGLVGWVKTTDVSIGLGDAVHIRRSRTIFPKSVAEGQLDVRMPYVLRRVEAIVGNLLLTEEDRATYTFVDGSAGSQGGFAKVGLEIPYSSHSLGLEEATSFSISALFLEDKLLKIYVPGSDPDTESASCILSTNAKDLANFSLWVTENPSDRIAPSDNNQFLYVLMTNDDSGKPERVDPSLILAVNGGSTIKVRQIKVNNGPAGERLSAIFGDDCAQDMSQ